MRLDGSMVSIKIEKEGASVGVVAAKKKARCELFAEAEVLAMSKNIGCRCSKDSFSCHHDMGLALETNKCVTQSYSPIEFPVMIAKDVSEN